MANWKKVIVSGSQAHLNSLTLDTALTVANGGTGASTLTDGGILLGSGTSAITATAVLANGQLLIGDNSGDPAVATLTAGTGVTITNGAGSIEISAAGSGGTVTQVSASGNVNGITLTSDLSSTTPEITLGGTLGSIANSQLTNSSVSYGGVTVALGSSDATPAFNLADATGLPLTTGVTGTLPVTNGGTGLTTLTDKAVLITQDSGTDAITAAAMDGDGELLIGGSTNGPTVATLTGGSGITITNGDGTITIAADNDGDLTAISLAANSGLAGSNLTGPIPQISASINALATATVNVANDSFAFLDADDNLTKKDTIADLIASIDGNGLTATSGVLAVDYGTSSNTAAQGNVSLTFSGTANEVELSTNTVSTVGGGGNVVIGLPNDVTIANDLTVNGDLEVSGTASFKHSENLDVADKFITLASGSTGTTDGGIIVAQAQNAGTQVGEGYGFDGSVKRWGVTSSLDNDSGAIVPLDYMVTARATNTGGSVPSAAPIYGGASTGYGNIHVDTSTEDIYIYA